MKYQQLFEQQEQVPDGTYSASTSGYVATFRHNEQLFEIECSIGVRGMNIKDTVTVTDGVYTSGLLGVGKRR